jgi:hypothetical protein
VSAKAWGSVLVAEGDVAGRWDSKTFDGAEVAFVVNTTALKQRLKSKMRRLRRRALDRKYIGFVERIREREGEIDRVREEGHSSSLPLITGLDYF